MVRFKSCPKCGGDVLVDRDYYGWYEQCIQCGHIRELGSLVENSKPVSEQEKEETRPKRGRPKSRAKVG